MHFSKEHPLLLIGGGNMGSTLAGRWLDWKENIIVVESSALRRGVLQDDGFTTISALTELTIAPSVILLAVKPQSFPEIKSALNQIASNALVISIMAGVPLAQLPKRSARVMPNTPATLGLGMSVCCGSALSDEDKRIVNDLFAACGEVSWVEDENTLHGITAISGSGPAYVFAFMEALEHAALNLGIDKVTAHTIVKQTMLGAVAMTNVPFADFGLLREQVTSKGGTTEAALVVLQPKLQELLKATAIAALERSKALASQ